MVAGSAEQPRFHNYPVPLEGPAVPYSNQVQTNPALRGRLLELAASLSVSLASSFTKQAPFLVFISGSVKNTKHNFCIHPANAPLPATESSRPASFKAS